MRRVRDALKSTSPGGNGTRAARSSRRSRARRRTGLLETGCGPARDMGGRYRGNTVIVGSDLPRGLFRVIAAVLFAAVFVLLVVVDDPVQAISVLFVVPIALLALSDGLRGGATGALTAAVLTAVWDVTQDVPLNVLGWASRVTAFVLIGAVVGRFEDLARTYQRRRMDEAYAAELHDRVVQLLVVARYQLRDGGVGTEAVDEALTGAKEIISERLGNVEPGDLRLSSG